MADEAIKSMVFQLIVVIKEQLIAHWPYVIIFFALIIAGVILQILMLSGGGQSKLSVGFNRLIGSLTYSIFFMIILSISYWIFGVQVIDDIWFAIFGILSYPATGYFLRAIGFWYY
ncbi:MAG: hypothetical protein Q8L10_02520 [Candidatus Moranbacteria bacterium]|nr:hypothetical protein [Candidatus Moranbacteria bacterium]